MQGANARRGAPALRELVAEASRALARLDAGRLEELALSCQALNREWSRELASGGLHGSADAGSDASQVRRTIVLQAREAERDLAVFGRVLEATRANIAVMRRIRALRAGSQLDYGEPSTRLRSGHGDN
jgi:hypothetical protein